MPDSDAKAINKTIATLAELRREIASLQQQNALQRDEAIEKRLIDLRILAAPLVLAQAEKNVWKRESRLELPPGPYSIPEIHRSELSADHICSGILNHGALIVRNLLDKNCCAGLREDIDKTFEARQALVDGKHDGDAWYNVPQAAPERSMRGGGAIWAACAPRPMNTVLALYESLGLHSILDEYIGQETMLSVKKWVLRKAEALEFTGWHQDGAFMGSSIRSANLWISLSNCGHGTDSPGIDIVPGRLENIIETGTNGAFFDWSVGDQFVDATFHRNPPVTPVFNEGDAVFFDHFNLHRTSPGLHYSQPRYAIECWFLGAENYPQRQLPMLW
ncbi:MAG: hypothetical protein AAF542_10970 [Pseudomonadota bacterium]